MAGLGFDITTRELVVFVVLGLVMSLLTSAAVSAFLLWIPPDHFVAHRRGVSRRIHSPVLRLGWRIAKNLLGLFLVVLGIVLALPGVPGPGLLTVLVGLFFVDLPGKRKLERALLGRRPVRSAINRLREKFNRPKLLLEPEPPASGRELEQVSESADSPPSDPKGDVSEP